MHEALFYEQTGDGQVVCGLCAHRCRIADGQRGRCGVRLHQEGRLYSLVYGRLVAQNIDPVEKKPMFHFLPGSRSFSIATMGCNFRCHHCQNYQISQVPRQGQISGVATTPEAVVKTARDSACASISYTYVEPTIFYEFAYDCASLARTQGVKNIFVSNGYITPEVVRHLAPVLDGINIDLKAFSDDFYRTICHARLDPVLESIRMFHQLGILVEVTTLIIPGLNDDTQQLRAIAAFLRQLSADIPWHVSAFRPTYKMLDRPATPPETLLKARAIGLEEGLHFVYVGNVAGVGGEDTVCPACGALLVRRAGFSSQVVGLQKDHCHQCQAKIAGTWS